MYKFMSIGGNCANTFFLGDNRIKGPVDNTIVKTKESLEIILTNRYFDHIKENIKNNSFIISKRPPSFANDSEVAYDTKIIKIPHNNPYEEKYIIELEKRCNNLKKFLKEVLLNDNYYLIYSLNYCDVNIKTNKLIKNTLLNKILYIKKLGLLDKTIFIETTGKGWLNCKSPDFQNLVKKYNLTYLEMNNFVSARIITKSDLERLNQQFMSKFLKAINDKNKSKSKSKLNTNKDNPVKTYLNNSNYYGL